MAMTIEQYLPLFVTTVCLELFIYGMFIHPIFSRKQIFGVCFLLNLSTHPLVCLVFPIWIEKHSWIPAELFAWVVEALILLALTRGVAHYKMHWTKAFVISLAANAFSAGVGLLFFSAWPIT